MLHYHMSLEDVLRLTPEQAEFLFTGLVWWGAVKLVSVEKEQSKWGKLRRMIPVG